MPQSYKEFPPIEKGEMKTLPPGSGMAITIVFSLLIWAGIAGIFAYLVTTGP